MDKGKIRELIGALKNWRTDWDGTDMKRGEPPRDGIHCDVLYDAGEALSALLEEVEGLRLENEELDFLKHEGGPQSVAAMEKVIRSMLHFFETGKIQVYSDTKTVMAIELLLSHGREVLGQPQKVIEASDQGSMDHEA